MPQQTSGLRFDIYERVQLPDDAVPVKEFNGLELSPDISVTVRGDQAVLHGHLALTGTYAGVGDTGGDDERLDHQIPVEITLPLHRVSDVGNIQIGIENFDVDLLTPRTLNVTGVLLLEGVDWSAPAESSWRQEEEVVFTHQAADPGGEPAAADSGGAEAAASASEAADETVPTETVAAGAAAADEEESVAASAADPPPVAERAEPEDASSTEAEPAVSQASEEAEAASVAAAYESEQETAEEVSAVPEEPETAEAAPVSAEAAGAEDSAAPVETAEAADAQEIKIQFTGKPASAETAPIGVSDIVSMTSGHSAAAAASADIREEDPGGENGDPAADSDARDRLEWKRMFLSPDEAPGFRKVRMCIAQKEDTIETIAEKYQKSPRELMLHNRLKEPYLQEGQVIYIP